MPENMEYEITRLEEKKGRVFFNIEIIDETGWYNFAKWLTPAQQAAYEEDKDAIYSIVEKYLPAAKEQRKRNLEAEAAMLNNPPPED